MTRPFFFTRHACVALAAASTAMSTLAALKPGDAAPPFKTDAAVAGKSFAFDMAAALKKGPVVLYFFPKAFTKGCTVEANAFAEATPRFAALGATVVGMSHDTIETLKKFSVEECRDKFAVASDPDARTIRAYDAASLLPGMASRISYVVGQDGKVVFAHQGSDPLRHVEETLKAVERLSAARR
ncbi:peroxiredoxin [Ottowia sp. GY511]|uniref:thioredoxin-dependent peroxiredoxin n=1 Tax=Ottowia flava TaxID=2675430 RepID=A0ABW4KRB1_9BURK|nr:peroxiredoxin [Ottowia sp. GY511]